MRFEQKPTGPGKVIKRSVKGAAPQQSSKKKRKPAPKRKAPKRSY